MSVVTVSYWWVWLKFYDCQAVDFDYMVNSWLVRGSSAGAWGGSRRGAWGPLRALPRAMISYSRSSIAPSSVRSLAGIGQRIAEDIAVEPQLLVILWFELSWRECLVS